MSVREHECVADNDGTCHWCGKIVNPDWYLYTYGEWPEGFGPPPATVGDR